MDKIEAEKELTKMTRSLRLTTVSTIEMVNDFEARVVLKTKCNDRYFDDFENHLYNLIDLVEGDVIQVLQKKVFEGDKYIGTVRKNTEQFNSSILDHLDVTAETRDLTDPESLFIQTISTALRNNDKTTRSDTKKLKPAVSARKLAYVIGVLCDIGIIDPPKKAGQVNRQELAHQVLGSFEIKTKIQTLRKAVDVDTNPLDRAEKLELFDQIDNALRKFEF